PGLLSDPGGVGTASHARETDPAGAEFDEERDVERLEEQGLHREEVTGENSTIRAAPDAEPGSVHMRTWMGRRPGPNQPHLSPSSCGAEGTNPRTDDVAARGGGHGGGHCLAP